MTRIFMNSDITRCKPFDINRRVFTYCDNLHWLWWESEWVAALLQYSDFARAVHNRQFVGEAFFLSDRDYALIVFFLYPVG